MVRNAHSSENSLLLFLATVTLELEGPSRSEREVGHGARRGCPEIDVGSKLAELGGGASFIDI